MKVAFIGLGNMGSGIAQRIAAGGFDLTVWNRTQSKMTPSSSGERRRPPRPGRPLPTPTWCLRA